ncbi:MAG: acyltransferase family protein [Vulcanimicrobiaceae bacterium]
MSATSPPASEQERLGSIALDQWRGLALVLVLISHGFYFTGRVDGLGRVGVNLFFFISGILVFRSLSRSRAKTGWERTRTYWWRRLRRLYPALAAYVLAMLPLAWLLQHRPNLPPDSDFHSYLRSIPPALTGSINYVGHVSWSLGHLWSIACEAQFYLLAPLIFIAGGVTGRRRDLVFGIMLLVLAGLGMAQPFVGTGKYQFEFAVWPMTLGFCCEYKRDWFRKLTGSQATMIFRFASVVGGLSLLLMLFGLKMKVAVVATGTLLLAPCLIAYLFGRPIPGIAGRCLKWLGERTYSIYLWQEPFTICSYLPNLLQPAGAVISVAVGGTWFHFFERPFLSASSRNKSSFGHAGISVLGKM